MKILVTGGSGVIGIAAIDALTERGYDVRLLSRHAEDDAERWKAVDPREGDIGEPSSVSGAVSGCEAVLHIAGIVSEHPPDSTFARVNVGGTQNLVDEMIRGGVRRLVHVSSLDADHGLSEYHRSKLAAEAIVAASGLDWTIVRPGNVYGPGDEVVSLLLKLLRLLPAVPVIDSGEQPFQPVWAADLGAALANIAERTDLNGRTLEVAGNEITSTNDVLDRLGVITSRPARRIPLPSLLASLAANLAPELVPIDDSKLAMLAEGSVVRGGNALPELLGHEPTALDEGLRQLASSLPEQLPESGVGALEEKRYRAVIRGSALDAAGVTALVRDEFAAFMPLEFQAEPGSPGKLDVGTTLTGSLPARGHIQVRVERADTHRTLLATVEGHPLAGTVEFITADVPGGVELVIEIVSRAANLWDLAIMRTVGAAAQAANWRTVIRRVARRAEGTVDGIERNRRVLDGDEAEKKENAVRAIVQQRRRNG